MLVGREPEKQRIVELLDDSSLAPGALRLIQLDGALGIGKSSLLAYALAARRSSAFLIHGDRLNAEGPLGAHRRMLEQLFGQGLEKLLDETTPRLLALRCAEALGAGPTLIAVDDAQWLDSASEEFLIHLLMAPTAAPLTLLLVHRTAHEPAALVSAARRRGAAHEHMTLGQISAESIEELVAGLPPQQVSAVVEAAQGNPLFARTASAGFRRHPAASHVEEVLRLEEGSQSAVLGAAILDDVNALSLPARNLVQSLAVLGGPCEEPAVRALSGLSAAEYAPALTELAQRGLLTASPHEALHPVVRFSVYQNTDPQWRVQAHRRAAALAAGETLSRAEHLARISAHLSKDEAALLVEAAALAIGSEPRTALRWLDSIPAEHRGEQSELLLARAEMLSGQVGRAAGRARALLRVSKSPAVKILLANMLRISGDLEEARAVLSAHSGTDDAEVLREAIDVHALLDGRAPEAWVRQLAARPGEENRVAAATYRTMDLLAAGEVPHARLLFTEVLPWMQAAPAEALRRMLHTTACAVWCAYMLDDFSKGAELAARGLKIAQRFGQADALANLGTGLAFTSVQLAQIPEAEAAAHQAVCDAQRYGPPAVVGMARAALLIAAQVRGDQDLLRDRYQQLKGTDIPRFGWWRRAVLTTQTRISALLGEPEPCPELLTGPQDAMAALRRADAALVAAAQDNHDLALSLIQEGMAISQRQQACGQQAMLQVTMAEILMPAGESRRSRQLLNSALEVFQQRGMALQAGRARAGLARLAAAEEQRADPLSALTQREHQIAVQVAQGMTSRQIAETLSISRRTVENHTANIMRKLGASSRHGIVSLLQNGRAG